MRRSTFEFAAVVFCPLTLAACATAPAEPSPPALSEAAQRVASYLRSKNVGCIREAIAVVHERPWEWACLWDELMDAMQGQPPDLQYDLIACCACVQAWACSSGPRGSLGTRAHDDIYLLIDFRGLQGSFAWERVRVLERLGQGILCAESILDGAYAWQRPPNYGDSLSSRTFDVIESTAVDVAVEFIDRYGLHALPEVRSALQRAVLRDPPVEPWNSRGEPTCDWIRAKRRMQRLLRD
jgi:hypothetical protein